MIGFTTGIWWREVDSNFRYQFLNCQTTAFRQGLQHSDESRGRLGIGRFGKSLDPGAPFDADMRNFAPSLVVIFPAPPAGAAQLHRSARGSHRARALACRGA